MARVCLVGAGYISGVHAEALRGLPGVELSAIVDPSPDAIARLGRATGSVLSFASVDMALAADAFDRAHVLVPPQAHARIAQALLEAGKPVLVEKPLATDAAECATLLATAARSGAALGVNQNFVHHPAFVRLRRIVAEHQLGRPNFVSCIYNVPLRQMAAGQLGHWMFHAPGNILLEQAVHPLSQIVALSGPIDKVKAVAGPVTEIRPGVPFVANLSATLDGRDLPAQLRFAVGQPYPFWQLTVVCDDGVVIADILANRVFTQGRTRWLEQADTTVSGLRTAGYIARDSVRNLAAYGLSTLHLASRSDAFFRSMRTSIATFHAALDAGTPLELDGRFGAGLVALCGAIADAVLPVAAPAVTSREPLPVKAGCDVAVIGGTGFIGRHLVRRLIEAGNQVSVLARSTVNLPVLFDDPRVSLHRGDIRDAEALAKAIGGARVVVNLAHGGGGGSWLEIRDAMVGGAQNVAETCLRENVGRLVHVGSIASLYLGSAGATITGATPPDPKEDERGDYARAKAQCERMLFDLQASRGLRVCILRPGVVVGAGSSPFHSGLGLFNNEQHCIGWNGGKNPLPFVLVEDVAEAILLACTAEGIDGHCYNLVGDVRPSARRYLADLAAALGRPLRFHPQSPRRLWLVDYGKWLVKRVAGRKVAPPALRDLQSRGMTASFDCADAKRALAWNPVADDDLFRRRAIAVHAP